MAEPEVVESPHPRLFAVHRPGGPTAEPLVSWPIAAYGVLWPDGSVTVNPDTESGAHVLYADLESMAGALGDGLTVVWLRQDEHAGV